MNLTHPEHFCDSDPWLLYISSRPDLSSLLNISHFIATMIIICWDIYSIQTYVLSNNNTHCMLSYNVNVLLCSGYLNMFNTVVNGIIWELTVGPFRQNLSKQRANVLYVFFFLFFCTREDLQLCFSVCFFSIFPTKSERDAE